MSDVRVSVSGPTTVEEAFRFYASYGLSVTPVADSGKEGTEKGWSQPGFNAPLEKFVGPRNSFRNIGVLNGAQPSDGWFFHDIDLDAKTPAALRIMERLLPPTGWIYGRAGNPRSHRNYLVKGAPLQTKKHGGLHGNIIELRGITQKKTHSLSVAPGSTHKTSEKILFVEPMGAIGRIEDPTTLDRGVRHVAVAIIIQQDWPTATGQRHDLRLAYAKVLLENGVPKETAVAILEAVMEATDSDVSDARPAVESTLAAMAANQPTRGASTIKDVLGSEVGDKLLHAIAKTLTSELVDFGDGIVMIPGERHHIIDRAIEFLLESEVGIYQRGGELVHVLKIPKAEAVSKLQIEQGDAPSGTICRPEGATVLRSVNGSWLLDKLGRVTRWFDAAHRRADPKMAYATTIIDKGEWPFPALRCFVTAPTLAFDGRIIEAPGLDVRSGTYVDVAPDAFPPVPVNPTKDDAVAALEFFAHPLRGFPFVSDAAKSVALAGMLTSLVRASLRTAPLHGFDAPTAGSGKTLLALLIGVLATGGIPALITQGKTDEEDEKRLSTLLHAGDPVIHIDNCERPLSGDFLCTMLTGETVQARILGLSERRILPCTALVLATGNNLSLAGDAARRAVFSRIDARMERPDARKFDFEPHVEVAASRALMVVAGLTILRAYIVAGKPEKLTPMGSFNDWEWIRGALVWLGQADPVETRAAIFESDPNRDEAAILMDLWGAQFGTRRVTISAIASECIEDHPLFVKLIEVACRGGQWNGQKVGFWLRAHRDRVIGTRAFRSGNGPGNQLEWWLEGAQAVLPGTHELINSVVVEK